MFQVLPATISPAPTAHIEARTVADFTEIEVFLDIASAILANAAPVVDDTAPLWDETLPETLAVPVAV